MGLDVGEHVANDLGGDRPGGGNMRLLGDIVAAGFTGRKAGAGFYLYPKTKTKGPKQENPEVAALLEKYRRPGDAPGVQEMQADRA